MFAIEIINVCDILPNETMHYIKIYNAYILLRLTPNSLSPWSILFQEENIGKIFFGDRCSPDSLDGLGGESLHKRLKSQLTLS